MGEVGAGGEAAGHGDGFHGWAVVAHNDEGHDLASRLVDAVPR